MKTNATQTGEYTVTTQHGEHGTTVSVRMTFASMADRDVYLAGLARQYGESNVSCHRTLRGSLANHFDARQ